MLRKCIFIAAAAVFIFTLRAGADYLPDRPLEWDSLATREVLPNGMQIFLRENHRPEKRLEIRLVVKAGALNEEDGTEGIAHFLEHMAFNGTTHFKAGEMVRYFESLGVDFGPDSNAGTGHESTTYKLTIPTDNPEAVDKGMTLMADYAGGILFIPEEIDKERGVILEEFRLYQGLYMRLARQAVKIAAKDTIWDTPRLFIVGDQDAIKRITRDDFLKFYEKWYRPDRMALILVGDMPVGELRTLVKKYIEPIPAAKGTPEFPGFPMPGHDEIRTGIISDKELPTGGGAFIFTRPYVPAVTEKNHRRDIIDSLCYRILNRRLRELKESTDPPFIDAQINSFITMPWFDLVGGFAMTSGIKKEKIALQAVLREMERVRLHGFNESEIREELSDMEESRRQNVEEKDKTFSNVYVGNLINSFVYGDTAVSQEERYRLIKDLAPTITPGDVKAIAAEMFAPVNMTLGVAVPSWQEKSYKNLNLLAWRDEVLAEDIQPKPEIKLARTTDYTKLKPAKIIERSELDNVGATRVKFENGLTVYLKKTDFQKDEINITSYSPHFASWDESWANFGITGVMQRLMARSGTAEFKDTEIERLTKGKGFSVSSGLNPTAWSINRDLEEAFQWLYDYIVQPGFREEALNVIKKNYQDEIRALKLDQDATFSKALTAALCPGHMMAITIEDENYYDPFTIEQVKDWWKNISVPANMQYTIVGNIDVEKTIELAARYLGGLPGGKQPENPKLLTTCSFPRGYTRRIIYKGMEDKTIVRVFIPGPNWSYEEFPAARVMAKILDTRIMERIREAMGGTYYSFISVTSDEIIQGKDYIAMGFATDPGRVEEMIKALDDVLAEFVKTGPTDKEVAAAREIFTKDWEEDLKLNDFWVGVLHGAEYGKQPLGWPLDLHEKMMAASAEQIKAAAAKWLTPPTDRVEIIAYKERKPEAAPAGDTESK